MEYILFPEGRILLPFGGNEGGFEYHLKDHLGSVRVAFVPNGQTKTVVQENAYYPFGAPIADMSHSGTSTNRYGYNGKEQIKDFGLGQYDYGARLYNPLTARWGVIDPLAEKGFGISAYAYCFNDPIKYIDPDGKWPWKKLINGRTYGTRIGKNAFVKNRTTTVDGSTLTRDHNGIDLGYMPKEGSLKGGENIRAAARGKVIFAGNTGGHAGNYIVIEHEDGYKSYYMHIQDEGFNVLKGQSVSDGEFIGNVGSTGRSSGPHLHFGIKKDDKWIDPTSIDDLDEHIHGIKDPQWNAILTYLKYMKDQMERGNIDSQKYYQEVERLYYQENEE